MRIPFLSYIYIPHSLEYIVRILSENLILRKRTLIHGLRRYDKDRCAVLLDPDEASHQGREVYEYEGNNIPSGHARLYGA